MRPFRQGDIMLKDVPPEEAKSSTDEWGRYHPADVVLRKRGEGIIVAQGEASGHHHRAREPRARLIAKGKKLFIRAPKGGIVLTHEEHDALEIPEGTFEIVRQREYQPPERASRAGSGSSRYVSD